MDRMKKFLLGVERVLRQMSGNGSNSPPTELTGRFPTQLPY
jgi:hypothetical protein